VQYVLAFPYTTLNHSINIRLLDSCQTATIDIDTLYENIYENNVKCNHASLFKGGAEVQNHTIRICCMDP